MINFKKLEWKYNEYCTSLIAKVKIFDKEYLAFQLNRVNTDDVILVDGQKIPGEIGYSIHVGTVEEGKKKAQLLFEDYCGEIINNISE